MEATKAAHLPATETVRIEGHIIDSLILPKVLDLILQEEGRYLITGIEVGHRREDPSWAEIQVQAADSQQLDRILNALLPHGATPTHAQDVAVEMADVTGAFPDGFYSTTNLPTEIRWRGIWIPVADQEMDCGIVLTPTQEETGASQSEPPPLAEWRHGPVTARCVPMHRIQQGQVVVIGRQGVRIHPLSRSETDSSSFQFMTSEVSSEKPKGVAVRAIASAMRAARSAGQKILLVGGPAIVHTGGAEHICELIRAGYIQILFAGNALATHDIEQAFFNTSLGVDLNRGLPTREGHEHHLRAINTIRRCGSIRQAVEQGILTRGIMYECIHHQVEFVLAGSIRDDGPLPDVITDVVQAADRMRELRAGIGFCLMVATTLHSIATGNILPATVRCACVDINPATVVKLADRGTAQSLGIVSDVEPFLRALVHELRQPGSQT